MIVLKKIIFKCIECGHEFTGHRDGLRCPKCNGAIGPIGEDIDVKNIKSIPPPKPQRLNKATVVLKIQSMALNNNSIEELENKYSSKFGCKVVILESNLELVDYING